MVSVLNLTRGAVPRLPWEAIGAEILGRHFEVSLVLIGEYRMAKVKREHPPHGYSKAQARDGRATNVLSFSIDKRSGEILLCPRFIRKEAAHFGRGYTEHLLMLYIHGLLHLKGFDHQNSVQATKMKKEEERYFNKFKTRYAYTNIRE